MNITNFLISIADHLFGAAAGRAFAAVAQAEIADFLATTPNASEEAVLAYVNSKSAAIIDQVVTRFPAWAQGPLKKGIVQAEDAVIKSLYEKVVEALAPKT